MCLAQSIPSIPVGDLTPWTLIGIVVLLVLTGRLMPRSLVEDMMDSKDRQIRDWKAAYKNEREARSLWAEHTTKLTEGQELIVDVVQAIRKVVQPGGERPDP